MKPSGARHFIPTLLGSACLALAAPIAGAGELSRNAQALSNAQSPDPVEVIVTYDQMPGGSEGARVGNLNGQVTHSFQHIPMRVIHVPAVALQALAQSNGVRFVSINDSVESFSTSARETAGLPVNGADDSWMPATSYDVGIAVVDSGVIAHGDINQPGTQFDCRFAVTSGGCSPGPITDAFGHRTHVAGTAGGNGYSSDSQYVGVAEDAPIVSLRVLGDDGRGDVADVITALDWILGNGALHNIRIVNLSLGKGVEESNVSDPLVLAAEQLWDAG